MFPNLRAEMARKNINALKLSAMCDIPNTTLSDKIKGKTKISLDDAIAIKKALGVDMDLEVLFLKEADFNGDEHNEDRSE